MVRPLIPPLPHTADVPDPSETESPIVFPADETESPIVFPADEIESPVVFPADPTAYAGVPATFPIKISQITAEFGGNSLLTAAPAAGLSAPVSISSFAGMSVNEGSGTFTATYQFGTGTGYSLAVFGIGGCIFPNGNPCTAIYQGLSSALTTIVVKAMSNANNDSVFKTIKIGAVTLNRISAAYSGGPGSGQWTFSGIPLNTIVDGGVYTPIFRTT